MNLTVPSGPERAKRTKGESTVLMYSANASKQAALNIFLDLVEYKLVSINKLLKQKDL